MQQQRPHAIIDRSLAADDAVLLRLVQHRDRLAALLRRPRQPAFKGTAERLSYALDLRDHARRHESPPHLRLVADAD